MSSEWCCLDVNTGGEAVDTAALIKGTHAFRVCNVCGSKWTMGCKYPLMFFFFKEKRPKNKMK